MSDQFCGKTSSKEDLSPSDEQENIINYILNKTIERLYEYNDNESMKVIYNNIYIDFFIEEDTKNILRKMFKEFFKVNMYFYKEKIVTEGKTLVIKTERKIINSSQFNFKKFNGKQLEVIEKIIREDDRIKLNEMMIRNSLGK